MRNKIQWAQSQKSNVDKCNVNVSLSSVKGNWHQGDTKEFSPHSVGKQCVANSCVALIYATVLSMEKWISQHLDLILRKGEDLYNKINSSHDYLLVNEIPQVINEFGGQYKVEKYQEMFGLLYSDYSSGDCLDERLHTMLTSMEKYNVCSSGILCLSSPGSASGSSCALKVLRNNYYLFDPHSRDVCGRPVKRGASVLRHFRTAGQCYTHIYNLGQTLKCNQFEITLMKVIPLWLSNYVEDQKSKQDRSQRKC